MNSVSCFWWRGFLCVCENTSTCRTHSGCCHALLWKKIKITAVRIQRRTHKTPWSNVLQSTTTCCDPGNICSGNTQEQHTSALYSSGFMEKVGNTGAWGSEEDQRLVLEQKNANVSAIQKDTRLFVPPHTCRQKRVSGSFLWLELPHAVKCEVWLGLFIEKHHREKDQRQNRCTGFVFVLFLFFFTQFSATSCRRASSCSTYWWHTQVLLSTNSISEFLNHCTVPYRERLLLSFTVNL